jgi:hypothetical protein
LVEDGDLAGDFGGDGNGDFGGGADFDADALRAGLPFLSGEDAGGVDGTAVRPAGITPGTGPAGAGVGVGPALALPPPGIAL